MADEILYLEADEEITSVVDKLKGLEADAISLVAPKGSTIVQSVVSLKLLKKQAESLKKKIAIVTTDAVGRNLASRVGLPVFADTKSAEPLNIIQDEVPDVGEVVEIDIDEKEAKLPKDFEVHRYDQGEEAGASAKAEEVQKGGEPVKSAQVPEEKAEPAPVEQPKREFVTRPVSSAGGPNRAEMESARPMKAEAKAPKMRKSGKRTGLKVVGIILGILIVVVLADLVFAKVTVNIAIPAEIVQENIEIAVERDTTKIDVDNGIIPGTQVQKEEEYSDTFTATGEKNVGEKATGTLTFKNEAGVDEVVNAGTAVVNSSGLEFSLQTSITVPKATLNQVGDKVLGQVNGSVEAGEAGDDYNYSSSATYSIYGKSKISISGGTAGGKTRVITVVSNSDIANAQDALQEKGKQELVKSFDKDATEEVIEGAEKIEVVSFASTKNANDEAQEFKATARIRATSLAYKVADLQELSLARIEESIEDGKGLLTTDGDVFDLSVVSSDINVGKVTVDVAVTTHTGPAVDLSNLSSAWRFKTISQIEKEAGEIPEAEVKGVTLWPKYALPISPILKNQVIVNLEYIKK